MIWQPPSFQAYTSFLRHCLVELEPAADALLEEKRDDADEREDGVKRQEAVGVPCHAGAEESRQRRRQNARKNRDEQIGPVRETARFA
jgi:hypothetical protein